MLLRCMCSGDRLSHLTMRLRFSFSKAWVRTCLAVLGFGLAFARLFPVSIYGVNMSNYIAYASIGSSLFLLVDATTR